MTTATQRLNIALITMGARGERPRCADPVDHDLWTSESAEDRAIAVKHCIGCVIIVECGDAADELGEKWYVFGGVDRTKTKAKAA